ncbi:MAG: hypothetical protein IJR26_00045 [Bacteroidales bacterium]|nr:hypothetical protein [Bacteroidales bacterium]
MERLILPLLLLLLAACQREADLPEATSAAKEVYLQYADRKDLTVAMIGDYQGYNAVMLQAQDVDSWLRLCEEFGVGKRMDAAALDSTRVTSLKSVSFNVDSLRFSGNLDSLQLQGSVGKIFTDLLDSLVRSKTGSYMFDTAYSYVHSEHWDNGVLIDSSTTVSGHPSRNTPSLQMPLTKDRLLHNATEHGHRGYLIHDDSPSLTLWLFFYTTNNELSQIINTITLTH